MSRRLRLLVAEADGRELLVVRAHRGEIALGRVGAALPEGQVVLLGAAFVAVPLDADLESRVLGEHGADGRELVLRLAGQRRGIELEEDADVPQRLHRPLQLGLALRVAVGRGSLRGRLGNRGGLLCGLVRLRIGHRLRARAGAEAGGQ